MHSAILFLLTWVFCGTAMALPHPNMTTSAAVYLKPTATIPTGHYSVAALKKNLITQERVRWVYVKTAQGQTGWVPKQRLLNPMHFSTQGRLMVNAPLFKERYPRPQLASEKVMQETNVAVLDVDNEWIKISYNSETLWTTAGNIFPLERDAGYFYNKKETVLRDHPGAKGASVKKIPAGSRLTPLETSGGEWVKVAYEKQAGYVPTSLIISRLDIAMKAKTSEGYEESRRDLLGKKIFAIYVNPLWVGTGYQTVNVHQQPSISSPVIGRILPWQNLMQQDSVQQEWAVSFLKELKTNVWWEIKDTAELQQLTQLDIKNVRKVLSNPVFSHLKVASADGLYRSADGQYWAPLRDFQGYNPAFTFSKDGILFVEDKLSVDNGEHFTSYVHWEQILKGLRDNRIAVNKKLHILNIETLNSTSQQLILEIDVGARRPVKAYTGDRGKTWAILKL